MARIGEIQSKLNTFTPMRPPVAVAPEPPATSTSSGSSSGNSFSQALSEAVSAQNASPVRTATTPAPVSNVAVPTTSPAAASTPSTPASSVEKTQKTEKPDNATAPAKTKKPAADTPPPSSASGSAIVDAAKKHLGIPYVWGGNSPSQGFDCSGLVKYVMKELGVDMPRLARQQATVGTEIGSLAQAKPGDLLGMRNGKHIAIYLGDNKILHAPQPGEKVSIRSLQSWDDIDTIRRVVPPSSSAQNASMVSRMAFEGAAA